MLTDNFNKNNMIRFTTKIQLKAIALTLSAILLKTSCSIKTCWVWRWRGFRSGLYREVTRMANTDALADEARHHLGKEYVKWYEFATAKWAAPRRFTCTTLVWWCSKKAYGVNVSNWYSPLVTPSGLFTDSNTYLIREVR